MNYQTQFSEKVNLNHLTDNPLDRASGKVKDILNGDFCIDVHAHLFDIKCINKSYFIIRMLKDLVGLKSGSETYSDLSIEQAYNEIDENDENWEDELEEKLRENPALMQTQNTKGIIDIYKARKFLGFKTMEEVYDYYLENFSLSKVTENKKVIVTALMMDLETGWNVKLKKSLYDQIIELKALRDKHPVLPFFVCDPRRADLESDKENLYSLFNLAFSKDSPFFGVKIYPALGYDPSDYRLWPIYEVCEKYKIPVLSHCGGESITTDITNDLVIYEGDKKVSHSKKNRTEVGYSLNDPKRWTLVLEKFPKLKLNLAHFGGYETWSKPSKVTHNGQARKETIFDFMEKYENVFADFSYNLIETDLSKSLREVLTAEKKIRERTLFGTDYWVVSKEGDLLKEQREFLTIMDDNFSALKLSELLTVDNPKKYLFG
ncbi:amidohydrolase family protein [Chryseobacterium scophthalmum]|uniref:Amidohydrolase n=1 Tax=Chryseobacterium scophthalmum TaxID=59733 RepID=A0A1N6EJB9_9FLAO|nr:amidohydrolase family protein [Chryseobacterium scophthalmum]SIN83135.1 Amidohydrolase [Chryseobacterium scophthalmum]